MNHLPILSESVDHEIYHLLCMVLASPELRKRRESFAALGDVRQTWEASEVSMRLALIAALLRRSDEETGGIGAEKVGEIKRGDRRFGLSFGEACDAILSSDEIALYPGAADGGDSPALSSVITLSGTRDGSFWSARLDLLEFLAAAAARA